MLKNKKLRTILIIILSAVLIFSLSMAARDLIRSSREKNAFDALALEAAMAREAAKNAAPASVSVPSTEAAAPRETSDEGTNHSPEAPPVPTEKPVLPQYTALHDRNPDLAGWLRIDDTDVDYPVMYTPEDQNFYLHTAFDGSYAESGCLFIGGPWDPEGAQTIIYGHHMNNGSMFGNLNKYADPEYGKTHPTFRFDTLTEEREYTFVLAFYSKVIPGDSSDGRFRYYNYPSLKTQAGFEYFVENIQKLAIYDTGVPLEWGDRLLTLSTCNYHTSNGRFVVVAKLKT